MDLNKLAIEIHEQNKAVGWWDDYDRCIYQSLQLVSTEFAEATEGERKNLMDSHLPHRKAGEVELADGMIRALDLGGRYGWKYESGFGGGKMIRKVKSIAGKHLALNVALSRLAEQIFMGCGQGQASNHYSGLVNDICHVAEHQGYDIMAALHEKLAYNRERADHKRENRAKANGKKF